MCLGSRSPQPSSAGLVTSLQREIAGKEHKIQQLKEDVEKTKKENREKDNQLAVVSAKVNGTTDGCRNVRARLRVNLGIQTEKAHALSGRERGSSWWDWLSGQLQPEGPDRLQIEAVEPFCWDGAGDLPWCRAMPGSWQHLPQLHPPPRSAFSSGAPWPATSPGAVCTHDALVPKPSQGAVGTPASQGSLQPRWFLSLKKAARAAGCFSGFTPPSAQ